MPEVKKKKKSHNDGEKELVTLLADFITIIENSNSIFTKDMTDGLIHLQMC
jgi:hypothetical protein